MARSSRPLGKRKAGYVLALEPSPPDEHGATAQRLALERALAACYNDFRAEGYWDTSLAPYALLRGTHAVRDGSRVAVTVRIKLLRSREGVKNELHGIGHPQKYSSFDLDEL